MKEMKENFTRDEVDKIIVGAVGIGAALGLLIGIATGVIVLL